MTTEADEALRKNLKNVVDAMMAGEGQDPAMKRAVGNMGREICRQNGVRSWAEFKAKLTADHGEKLLASFKALSDSFRKKGDAKALRAVDILVMSLLKPERAALVPGGRALDRYVDSCIAALRPSARVVASTARARQ